MSDSQHKPESEGSDDEERRSRRLRVIVGIISAIIILLLLLQFCQFKPDRVVEQRSERPAQPTAEPAEFTKAEKPVCTPDDDCVVVARVSPGHRGERIDVLINPNLDDPIANWSRCLDAFMVCIGDGGAPDACLADAPCDDSCKTDALAALTGVVDVEAGLDVFEGFYVRPDAACYPAAGQGGP